MSRLTAAAIAAVALVALAAPGTVQAATESLVTVGSPPTPFPQNKQNEPHVAIDPANPSVVAAGANEEIDQPPCGSPATAGPSDCPFAPGVGTSGIYFSFDGGSSWTQPTYQGWSGRDGTLGPGPIGTLPNYFENGLVSDGDPIVEFGPQPDARGDFSWENGSRLYYANLTANFETRRKDFTFKGFEAIGVSHSDDPASAAAGDEGAWSDPTLATARNQSSATFSDKEEMTVDTAEETSPHFGNVYVCYSRFQSAGQSGFPVAIHVTRSTDGGVTFDKPLRLTRSNDPVSQFPTGRQGCSVDTDSDGVVYVVWEDTIKHHSVFRMARSFDGGKSFEKKEFTVARVVDVGRFDLVRSISFDGIAGARTSSFPSLDIANGEPSGVGAPDTLALGWSDGAEGLNDEHALVQLSDDRGETWTDPEAVEEAGDRPDFAFLGISPDGSDLYVVYDGFLDPFRNDTTSPRRFEGVTRHANLAGTSLGAFTTLDRGEVGDARASSANTLIDEFIGDYNAVDATNGRFVSVFNDARDAAVCPAMNDYRRKIAHGRNPPAPAPGKDCPPTFGNTDIWSASGADPTR